MEEQDRENLLNTEGKVELKLTSFLFLRDNLEILLKTTDTQKEFLRKFRLSLLSIIEEGKRAGIDLTELYSYYKDLEFPEVKGAEIIKLDTEDQGGNTPDWLLRIDKQESDEKEEGDRGTDD